MADVKIHISSQKYQARITTLQGYVRQLQSQKTKYQGKMKEIPHIWSDSESDVYYDVINENITKVQQAIDAANLQIQQLQNIVTNQETTASNISSIVNDAASIAQALFK